MCITVKPIWKKSVLYKVLFKAGLTPIFDGYIKDI